MRRKSPWSFAFALLFGLLCAGRAEAYPYQALRPADQVIGGPTDGYLSSMHYNPAGLRLFSGSQLLAVAGVRGFLGGYQRSEPLPAGFAPGPSAPQSADGTRIGWVASDMLVAGSWDLSTESVTLGFALYTPNNDETSYADPGSTQTAGAPGSEAQHLATRYHAISDRTYSLWGTVAAGLKVRPWLYLGGGFQFAYTRSRLTLMRDLGANQQAEDGLSCAGSAPCEQWSQRQLLDLDVSGFGYGFTAGILAEPIDGKLWLGLSYVSTLFTSVGPEVGLDGRPQTLPWQGVDPSAPCGPGGSGVRVTQQDESTQCGSAHMSRSFPHMIYLGARVRLDRSAPVFDTSGDSDLVESRPQQRRRAPTAIELTGWARLTVPSRQELVLSLERRLFPPVALTLPLAQRTAVALAFGVRQLWPRLVLAQELLYESPRTDPAAVSPANLEGHKLDLSLAARLKLQRRLWLVLTVGLTGVIFGSDAGSRFSPSLAADCRQSGYDVTTDACRRVQEGFAVPTAAGSYWLVIPHGVAGLEVNL